MTPADRLRAYVDRYYLGGSPKGRELLTLADELDGATRVLLVGYLAHLHATGCLSCPPSDLAASVDEFLATT
jgi:hypothetical protein